MARKRMIDPGIWTNVQVARLTVLQRLLYVGLISNADDEGRLNGDPTYIKGIIFPHDNITIQAITDALKRIAKESLIVRYRVKGSWYVQHPNWKLFQYIQKPIKSRLPAYGSPTIPVTERYGSPTIPKQQQENGKEQNRTEQKSKEALFSESLKLLLSFGIPKNKAAILANQHPYNRIQNVTHYAKQGRNPGGLIISALEKGWQV